MEKSSEQNETSEDVKKLEKSLSAEKSKNKQYLDRIMYLQADFENYRKRVEKEISESVQRSNEKMVASLLDVLDDLETTIQAGRETENKQALLEGVEMIHKKMRTILEKEGLKEIEATGKSFDPISHEILARVHAGSEDEGTVLEETRKGYIFKGKVIRPSIVKISCKEEKEE